ncbi:hypothetical protein IV203_023623 [Nitzschia inconspicua]|uniref:Transcription activator GCR1-like domain-containing protein n=1 Tax=Nitzschia inconspicua TaxID=303405 RepID=A0A9K3KEJ6_9STRA|nr:hypothetical protein IV203_023623 [Nitzschia inconspicua]
MNLPWSKNTLTEEQCPAQILVGAKNTDYCVLVGLACYLESTLTDGNNKKYLFAESAPGVVLHRDGNNMEEGYGPEGRNERYQQQLTDVWKRSDFQRQLGAHSVRKGAVDYSTKCGKVLEQVEIRGRWKSQRGDKVANHCISVDQIQTDAAMATCLAVGGPVTYKIKPDSHVSVAWMLEHVVPSINGFYRADKSNHITQVLGVALLWAAFQPELVPLMSEKVRNRICSAYNFIRGARLGDYVPAERVPLRVFNVENKLCIEELTGLPMASQAGVSRNSADLFVPNMEQFRTLQIQNNRLMQLLTETQRLNSANYVSLRNFFAGQFYALHSTLGRLSTVPERPLQGQNPLRNDRDLVAPSDSVLQGAIQPFQIPRDNHGVQQLEGPPTEEYLDPTAKLISNPRDLLAVWHEWIHGHNGNKPAKNFSARERGRCRNKFCRRLAFWEVMVKLVHSGYSETAAIDHIKKCYGENLSVTAILLALGRDRRKGEYHPNLGVQPREVRRSRFAREN